MPDLSSQNAVWPHLETLVADFGFMDVASSNALFSFLKRHRRRDAGLTMRIPDTRAKAWKETEHPQITYTAMSDLCTVEEVPEEELRGPKPWPPGGDGVLGRRIDLEADPFVTKPIAFSLH
jgi:hypothetical protein